MFFTQFTYSKPSNEKLTAEVNAAKKEVSATKYSVLPIMP